MCCMSRGSRVNVEQGIRRQNSTEELQGEMQALLLESGTDAEISQLHRALFELIFSEVQCLNIRQSVNRGFSYVILIVYCAHCS